MAKQEITAVPKLVEPMDIDYFTYPAQNTKEYWNAKKRGKVLDSPYSGAELVSYGNNYRVLDHKKEKVTYLMSWQTRPILGQDAAYQVMVWSDLGTPAIRGYAPKVFFEQLFAKTGLICTDRLQTPGGRRFWASVVASALDKGFFVYFVDMNKHPRQYTPIPTLDIFNELRQSGVIWTSEKKGEGQLLLISKEKIPTMHKGESSLDDLADYPAIKAALERD